MKRIPTDPRDLLAEIEAARHEHHAALRTMRASLRAAGDRVTEHQLRELERAVRRPEARLERRRKLAKTLGVPIPAARPVRSTADKIAALERKIAELRAREAREAAR